MKTTTRTHRKARASDPKKQASTQPSSPAPQANEPALTLTVDNDDPQNPWMAITGFTAEEFAAIKASAQKRGEALPLFITSAIKAKLKANESALAMRTDKPASDAPWWNHKLQILISGNGKTEDCLWASPDGLLYLHNGSLSTEPREMTFDMARDWWEKFHDPRFEFAAPFFKEDSAAERLVCMVRYDWVKRQAGESRESAPSLASDDVTSVPPIVAMPVQKSEPIKRESMIRNVGFDMEEAVQRTLGLLDLLSRMVSTTARDEAHHSSTGIGFQVWSDDCRKALYDDWNAAHDANANRGGDKLATSRKLGATVGKARVLLLMMAHDLSCGGYFDDYEAVKVGDGLSRDFPDSEVSSYLSLAADCAEYLEACYYDKFGRDVSWHRFQKEHFEEMVQKFTLVAEERRAA